MKTYGVPRWTDPTAPSLVFLQSCLALSEDDALPFLQRGSIALVGSSTRIFSATGGAFTLAYFDALLYEDQSLGGALRQAKNYLLTYSLLKEQLLGKEAKFTGANVCSAWAFTLWGDPNLKLPLPRPPADAAKAFRHEVRDNTITFLPPETTYEKIRTGSYEAQLRPNARLAGLLRTDKTDEGEDVRRLVPFLFAEVHLPQVPSGRTPRLECKLPRKHWVFSWDGRRGYLLVAPRAKDGTEIRFRVSWEE